MSALRVLVVDDEIQMAETVADGLDDRGYDAHAAASGDEALARIRVEPFDALVTDLHMPGVDGLALLSAARDLSPEMPVLVMTAVAERSIEAIRRGASHTLTKPFRLDDLVLLLTRALDEQRVRREARALRAALAGGGAAGPVWSGPVLPVREIQRRYAAWALEACGGHRTRTAERLGIDMKTLAKWLSEIEVDT